MKLMSKFPTSLSRRSRDDEAPLLDDVGDEADPYVEPEDQSRSLSPLAFGLLEMAARHRREREARARSEARP